MKTMPFPFFLHPFPYLNGIGIVPRGDNFRNITIGCGSILTEVARKLSGICLQKSSVFGSCWNPYTHRSTFMPSYEEVKP